MKFLIIMVVLDVPYLMKMEIILDIDKDKQSGRKLLLHLKLRNILNKLSDKDYDRLIKLMYQEKVKKILKKYDRDTPIPLVLNLLLKEPRFLLFSRFAF